MRVATCLAAVAFALLMACGGSNSSPSTPVSPAPVPATPAPPPVPMSWAVKGQILAAPDGLPVAGTTLTVGNDPPVTADAGGNYSIVTTDSSTRSLVLSAPGFLVRETSLTGGQERRVDFDLIATASGFPLALYRMMARNGFERPGHPEPVRRWTRDPNVFIKTTWRDTGAPVDPADVDYLIGEIRRVIPQLTAGHLKAAGIETGPETRALTRGWINVEFGVSGNWSRLGEDPVQVQFGSVKPGCTSLSIIHEFGHAMGYWHSNVRPSIMGGGPGACVEYNLTPDELQVARVLYSREPGNLEPDKDGPEPGPPGCYSFCGASVTVSGAPAGVIRD